TLHTLFDHTEFAHEMSKSKHSWLLTYDDSPEIRENFAFAFQSNWELQYGMNNYKRAYAPKGKELFITNYAHQPHRVKQLALLESKRTYRTHRAKQHHPTTNNK